MCIGIPMRVVEAEPGAAWCEGRGERRRVNMALVGDQPLGTWVLVFLDAAREVMDEEHAGLTNAALDALAAALRGENVDGYFRDLIEREPQLPEHLRPQAGEGS